jgi:hypothetical protein
MDSDLNRGHYSRRNRQSDDVTSDHKMTLRSSGRNVPGNEAGDTGGATLLLGPNGVPATNITGEYFQSSLEMAEGGKVTEANLRTAPVQFNDSSSNGLEHGDLTGNSVSMLQQPSMSQTRTASIHHEDANNPGMMGGAHPHCNTREYAHPYTGQENLVSSQITDAVNHTMGKMMENMANMVRNTVIEATSAAAQKPVVDVIDEYAAQHSPNIPCEPRRSCSRGRSHMRPQLRRQPGPRRPSGLRLQGSLSSSDSESPNDAVTVSSRHTNHERNYGPKLPPFTGDKEKWKVWFTRFQDIAARKGWSEEDCLDELLPRLQGQAGEFVYDQLGQRTRQNYPSLIKELNVRFRRVESTKTFGTMFSHRSQKPGETAEEYSAELKRLYDKAHPQRDQQTRQEDLLRRFLDGLLDDRTRFHVEYVKSPETIDDAVNEVVNFIETRKKTSNDHGGDRKKYIRAVQSSEWSGEESNVDDDDDRVARVPTTDTGSGRKSRSTNFNGQKGNSESTSSGNYKKNTHSTVSLEDIKKICVGLTEKTEKLCARVETLEKDVTSSLQKFRKGPNSKSTRPTLTNTFAKGSCFGCGSLDHFIKDCPKRSKGSPGDSLSSVSENKVQILTTEVTNNEEN